MKYKLNSELIIQDLDNDIVIFDTQKSLLYTFNETAACIIRYVKKPRNLEDIVKEVIRNFEVSLEDSKKDVDDCIDKLLKYNIITTKN